MATDGPGFDPYKVLQVDPEAEQEVVEAAYRRLARKYHPDVAASPDAAARMTLINRAWELVGDPADRRAHDLARRAAPRTAVSSHRPPDAPSAAAPSTPLAGTPPRRPQPDTVSRDWTAGRSFAGGGYDPASMRTADGDGAAGPPPGDPSGSVLTFGRYAGWSLGEIARRDLEYLEWLDRMPIGRLYRAEIDAILRRTGRRRAAAPESERRHGLFRRR